MNYRPLRNLIHLVDIRNRDGKITNLLGINIKKQFMPSVANVIDTDLTNYKVISKGQFAYSAMQTGRDETIRIVLYTYDEPAIISPAYSVIEVNNKKEFLPEYMMMLFLRPESDRYGWFISDSSVRASLDYERLCEIEIPVPEMEEQKKYVTIHNTLNQKLKLYEKSIEDLEILCKAKMEELIVSEEKQQLGDYIEQVDKRNEFLETDNLIGISVNKVFIPTKSKKEHLDLTKYKIVDKNQLAYVTVTSRNGGKISIALQNDRKGLLSSTYLVFDTKHNELLPQYLYIIFSRPEFDRYARFHSWGSARETFDWNDMCNVKVPMPDLEVQQALVNVYNVLEKRKKIYNRLKEAVKNIAPVLIKGIVENELEAV